MKIKGKSADGTVIHGVVPRSPILYDFTVATPQAAIDTFVDDGGDGVGALLSQEFDLLEMWILSRTSEGTSNSSLKMILNNDSASHYDVGAVQGHDGSVSAVADHPVDGWVFFTRGDTDTAGYAGQVRLSMLSYARTDFKKTAEATNMMINDVNEAWERLLGLSWRDDSAVDRVKITAGGGGNFLAGTRLLIKGS